MTPNIMEKLAELVTGETFVQGAVTFMLIAADIYLVIVGIQIPDILGNSTLLALGFWFGSKTNIPKNNGVK